MRCAPRLNANSQIYLAGPVVSDPRQVQLKWRREELGLGCNIAKLVLMIRSSTVTSADDKPSNILSNSRGYAFLYANALPEISRMNWES